MNVSYSFPSLRYNLMVDLLYNIHGKGHTRSFMSLFHHISDDIVHTSNLYGSSSGAGHLS